MKRLGFILAALAFVALVKLLDLLTHTFAALALALALSLFIPGYWPLLISMVAVGVYRGVRHSRTS